MPTAERLGPKSSPWRKTMSLAGLVAFAMLALLIGWVAIVLYATFRQLDGEAREKSDGDG